MESMKKASIQLKPCLGENMLTFTDEQQVQNLHFEAWAKSYEEVFKKKPTPSSIWPTRAERKTTWDSRFGSGNTTYYVNIRQGDEGSKPVGSQGVTDYGSFYAGGGGRSMAGPELFTKKRLPSRKIGGIRIDKGWSEIIHEVIGKYTDKPFLMSVANKKLIRIFKGMGFSDYNPTKANLSKEIKNKLENWPHALLYRDGGEMKKSFDYIWSKYIVKCDL